ncbi:MAG: ABC transporter permease [Armatimonadetes bacterium]|nr:ABC transporter permease [Armatimonadota bacterium]
MLGKNIKIVLRNLRHHKKYSIINILGLAIGMASVILILLYVTEELSYDRFQTNRDRIYRFLISISYPNTGTSQSMAIGAYRMADELRPDFMDLPDLIRIAPNDEMTITHNNKTFIETKFAFVDDEIFNVFSFELISGDPEIALKDPFSVVVSREIAQKYFGSEDAVGQALHFEENDFTITGILAPIPGNTQFDFNMLASMNCAQQVFNRIVLENWGEAFVENYLMLPEGKKPADYHDRFAAFIDVKLEAWKSVSPKITLQPLSEIYLQSENIQSYFGGGNIAYVLAFSAIALIILIIACINFMNLATARSAKRAKEVGMRKVAGAQRGQIIQQFLGESVVLSLLSLAIALFLASICLPAFNQLAGKELTLGALLNSSMLFWLIFSTLFVGLAAGIYPALFLSAFTPISIMSGALTRGAKGRLLRKILVIFQLAISIFLIAVTLIVHRQLEYSRNFKVGYNKEHVLIIPSTPMELRGKYDQFRSELLTNPLILNAGGSSRVPPGGLHSSLGIRAEGISKEMSMAMQTVWTDFNFIETMQLELASGRSFSQEFGSDAASAFIINESAVKKIGWTNEEAIGKGFGSSVIENWDSGQWQNRDGQIIGVLKDFHFESMHHKIVPVVYFVAPQMAWQYVIRIALQNTEQAMEFIEQKWEQFNPNQPFVYSFVDTEFDELYRAEQLQGKIFTIFAALAIFVACLGLVGLASFTAEQRTKEVGIRKVLGATETNLILLITKEFTLLVIVSFAAAAPVAWYFMNNWLQNFAYHVALNAGTFILAGIICLIIVWLTVGFQALKVAVKNPIDALRYE